MTRNERQLKATEQEMERHGTEADAILSKASDEDRETTPDEKSKVEDHLKAIKTLKETKSDLEDAIRVEGEVRSLGKQIGVEESKDSKQPERPKAKSFGEQFVDSDGFQRLKSNGLTGNWSTGRIDLETKATLFEGDLGTPGAGAPLVPTDQRTGVQPILFNRLTVANLLASGMTNSNSIRYVVETVATNAAATVAEGAEKPESALEFDQVDEPVRKVATFLPVSDEMLEDAAQIQSYINARLSLFVQQEEEDQILNGGGVGTDLNGLLNRVPVPNQGVYSTTATSPNAADHIYHGLTVVRGSYLEPDGVVVNPDDWAELRLLKDGNNNYIGGSPFSNGSEPTESLWNKRVVVTEAQTAGTALVGAFGQAAQVFRKGGLTVEASNSHSDFFRRNLTAIRAEERLALAVYRPEAFATVDLNGAAV